MSPIGFFKIFIQLVNQGARDLQNQNRFKGVIIESGCCIDNKTTISAHTRLFNNCILNNCEIASYTYIGKNNIIQNSKIGSFCSVANDVLIGIGRHPVHHFSTSPLFYQINNPLKIKLIDTNLEFQEYLPVQIGHDVWIGARAIIMDGISIGHGAIVAANSVVTKDVPPYAIVGGIPAKIIKYRFTPKKIDELLKSGWWNWKIEDIKKKFIDLNNTTDI
jgi:acetyltransferase-like isoleucine patch superfamily enzyme